jgi:acetyl esterase
MTIRHPVTASTAHPESSAPGDRTLPMAAPAVAAPAAPLAGLRRAPEHPWPAAVEDATHVVRWAFDHQAKLTGTDRTLVIAGDSSGGNLAALACLRLHDEGG